MKESITYQAIVAEGVIKGRTEGLIKGRIEGALEELRKVLLQLGEERFGMPAPAALRSRLEKLQDLNQLEQLVLQVNRVQSWNELLPTPRKPPRRR